MSINSTPLTSTHHLTASVDGSSTQSNSSHITRFFKSLFSFLIAPFAALKSVFSSENHQTTARNMQNREVSIQSSSENKAAIFPTRTSQAIEVINKSFISSLDELFNRPVKATDEEIEQTLNNIEKRINEYYSKKYPDGFFTPVLDKIQRIRKSLKIDPSLPNNPILVKFHEKMMRGLKRILPVKGYPLIMRDYLDRKEGGIQLFLQENPMISPNHPFLHEIRNKIREKRRDLHLQNPNLSDLIFPEYLPRC